MWFLGDKNSIAEKSHPYIFATKSNNELSNKYEDNFPFKYIISNNIVQY